MTRSRTKRVRRYIWSSLAPAAAVAAWAAALDHRPSVGAPWIVYPLLIVIGWVGEEYRVRTRGTAFHTLTAAVHLPLILLFTPLEAIALAAGSSVCSQLRRRRLPYIVAYNGVVRVIGVGVPASLLALWRLHDPHFYGSRTFLTARLLEGVVQRPGTLQFMHLSVGPYVLFSIELLAGCVLPALLYFVLDSALVSTVVALQTGTGIAAAWQANMRDAVLAELTKSAIGIIAACTAAINPIFVVFVALPVAVTHATTKAIYRFERETVEAVTALADSIDHRDPYTAQHSVRVAATSRRLAERLGLSHEQVEEIELAARVHDLGKMGISNDILIKEGKLTHEEMVVMQDHPRIGVEVLQKYHNFRAALPIVLHHHERYDGKGYPTGLAGDGIPLGAQIVAHADTYDAMTSDRPYRKGMPPDVAVQRIAEASGTQFNPAIAGVFVAMMREELAAAGRPLPATGGSLAETAVARTQADEPELLAAGAEDKVRYLYKN